MKARSSKQKRHTARAQHKAAKRAVKAEARRRGHQATPRNQRQRVSFPIAHFVTSIFQSNRKVAA
jgi:hypothetical protein